MPQYEDAEVLTVTAAQWHQNMMRGKRAELLTQLDSAVTSATAIAGSIAELPFPFQEIHKRILVNGKYYDCRVWESGEKHPSSR